MSVNKKNVRVYLANILSNLGETDGKIAGYILQQPAQVVQLPVKSWRWKLWRKRSHHHPFLQENWLRRAIEPESGSEARAAGR